jgi:DNA-binding CsgD family transcriptional regulator
MPTTTDTPYNDPGEKYKDNDVLGACPICNRGFWQRGYLVDGKRTPETCGLSHGQALRALREGKGGLTPREREVHALVEEGLSRTQIAERLGISSGTAKNTARIARLKVAAGLN